MVHSDSWAKAYLRDGDKATAIKHFDEVLALDPYAAKKLEEAQTTP